MSEHPELSFNHYVTYDEMTTYLCQARDRYPHLLTLSSVGKSYEGRDVWAVTLTNRESGTPCSKPALYCDGNIHAGEVTPCMVLLYAIDYMTQRFGCDEEVDHLLNTRTLYLLPRVNPDGAEKYLTTPHLLRSSVRPYPGEHVQDLPGLHPSDIDGDGKILTMRVRDDRRGEWRISGQDPRVMIPRRPAERGGPFYHLYREGEIRGESVEPFEERPVPWGLDINRNFPSNWHPEVEGGGPYPASEPEVKSIVDFIVSHNNIGGLQAFHTYGGFFYRNPYQYPEEEMDPDDLRATVEIAREGEAVTGYTDEKSSNCSTLTEWAYEHRGILGYTTEVWDRLGRAGVDRVEYRTCHDPAQREDMEIRLMQWNDRELSGRAFHRWRSFEHPQLGEVELGGWDPKFAVQNPPEELLHQECHKNTRWLMRHAGALPCIAIERTAVTEEAPGLFRIDVIVGNHGYLPTSASNKAQDLEVVRPDSVELEVPGNAERVMGPSVQDLGFLEGFMNGQNPRGTGAARSSASAAWMVRGERGSEVKVVARSERGGCTSRSVRLVADPSDG